jgi:hypothetical protein
MKLNYAPQAGLRRRRPDQGRQTAAFWAGIGILLLFEAVLMAKNVTPTGLDWSPPGADAPADDAADASSAPS